jgi:hypothetical protein
MMTDKVAPYAVPIVVQVMPTMVHAIRQTTKVPQMTSPHEKHFREQR